MKSTIRSTISHTSIFYKCCSSNQMGAHKMIVRFELSVLVVLFRQHQNEKMQFGQIWNSFWTPYRIFGPFHSVSEFAIIFSGVYNFACDLWAFCAISIRRNLHQIFTIHLLKGSENRFERKKKRKIELTNKKLAVAAPPVCERNFLLLIFI